MTELEDALRQTFRAEVDGAADRMLSDVRRGARRRRTTRTTIGAVAASGLVVAGVALGGSLLTRDDSTPSPAPRPTETVTDPTTNITPGGVLVLSSPLAVEAGGDHLYVTSDDLDCDCSVLYRRDRFKLVEIHRFPVPFVDRLSFSPDGANGWAAAAGQVWATHDAGLTWASLDLPPEAPEDIGDSYLVDSSASYAWIVNLGSGSLWRSRIGSDDFEQLDVPDADGYQGLAVVGDAVVVEPRPTGEGNTTSVPRLSTDGGTVWSELNWPCSGEHRLLPTDGAVFMTCEGAGEPEATIYRWTPGSDQFVGFGNPTDNLPSTTPLAADRVLVPGADPVLVTEQGAVPADTDLAADVSVWDAADVDGNLYLATTDGLLQSIDGGRTWGRI
ncbi:MULTISPECIES: hypothetical protein [unclassified Nocardioides]|uniref:hypothetical protein n=1 Tax=unclassified Nocardioides TaxID=2615069 RepID=UPI0006F87695|nr:MULTISPECIES: hypothetical protein [unclassified Nocardioides]KRA32715.1 hypothetical protein ASD81_14440 [Nocardioides sp. Root614]KRA89367.1 hypothetical protein ASD84_14705 [Nocardioides sp. Root682]